MVVFLNANPFGVDGRSFILKHCCPDHLGLGSNMATESCWKEGKWWMMTSDCRLEKNLYIDIFLMWQCWWCNKKPSGHVVVSSSTHIWCPNTSESLRGNWQRMRPENDRQHRCGQFGQPRFWVIVVVYSSKGSMRHKAPKILIFYASLRRCLFHWVILNSYPWYPCFFSRVSCWMPAWDRYPDMD